VWAEHDALFGATAADTRRAQRSERTSQRSIVCSPFSNDRSKTGAPRRHSTGFRAEHFARRRWTVVKVGELVNLDAFITETMSVPAATTDEELLACFGDCSTASPAHADAFVAEGLPPDLLKGLGDVRRSSRRERRNPRRVNASARRRSRFSRRSTRTRRSTCSRPSWSTRRLLIPRPDEAAHGPSRRAARHLTGGEAVADTGSFVDAR
jgi:hypothetical protein